MDSQNLPIYICAMNWKALQSHRNHAGPIYCLSEGRKDGEVLTGSSDGFVAAWSLCNTVSDVVLS